MNTSLDHVMCEKKITKISDGHQKFIFKKFNLQPQPVRGSYVTLQGSKSKDLKQK